MSWIGDLGHRAKDMIAWVALKGKVDDKDKSSRRGDDKGKSLQIMIIS